MHIRQRFQYQLFYPFKSNFYKEKQKIEFYFRVGTDCSWESLRFFFLRQTSRPYSILNGWTNR